MNNLVKKISLVSATLLSLSSVASYESETTVVTPAVDASAFTGEKSSGVLETIIEEERKGPYRPAIGLNFNYRYVGQLNKVGLEKSLYRQITAGLYYGRFTGTYYGNDESGFIPGLTHYSFETNIYLNSAKRAFENGFVLKFGGHYNTQKAGVDVREVRIDGEKVIGAGENKFGPLVGASYYWQWKYANLAVGMEYYTLGRLKSFSPLVVSLGVAF